MSGLRLAAAASSTTTFTNNSAQTYTINSAVESNNVNSSLAFAGSGNFLFNFAGDAFRNQNNLSGIILNSAYTGTVTIAAGSRAAARNGDITVNGGAFRLNGTTTNLVSITTNNGGTLLGSGTANDNPSNTGAGFQVNSGGVVNPGAIAGTGTLTINRTSTTFGAGSTLSLDLLSNISYDQLSFTLSGGNAPLTLTTTGLGAALDINLLTGFSAIVQLPFSQQVIHRSLETWLLCGNPLFVLGIGEMPSGEEKRTACFDIVMAKEIDATTSVLKFKE